MKTSLICLLLLAAVACAAPRAGEMPGEKRVGMAEKMREKMAENRKEIAEKMRERAKENGEEMFEEKRNEMAKKMRQRAEKKREESENAVAAAKYDGEAGLRNGNCNGTCTAYGKVGCFHDQCYSGIIFVDFIIGCRCCNDDNAPDCS